MLEERTTLGDAGECGADASGPDDKDSHDLVLHDRTARSRESRSGCASRSPRAAG
jgi:hypothetical protein